MQRCLSLLFLLLPVADSTSQKGAAHVPEWFVAEAAEDDANPFPSWFANRLPQKDHQRRAQKWSQYVKPYHRHLHKFRGKQVNMLEMGVQSGGSMHMWLDYFGSQARVFGLDVDNAVRVVEQDRTSQTGTNITGRIKVFTGDQGDPDFLRSLCTKIGRIDFIIDDASHIPWHQILGLEMLFPCLNPAGGVYMVEDLTDEKIAKAGASANESMLAYAYARALDVQMLPDEAGQAQKLRNIKSAQSPWQSSLESVSFYGSLIAFEKTSQRHAFNLDAGKVIIPKKTIAFVGVSREQAQKRASELAGQPDFWQPAPTTHPHAHAQSHHP